ncbi:DUF4013 domain-containing protein [Halobium salinum]|uniref:DUF4013 domain-containing protein n=1 Tax=Halobium salinum TaxID=1364940 RepID=A0ABD5PE98_9EURY|nr:DUF4013 domain-containing protein [Halobium salinum]
MFTEALYAPLRSNDAAGTLLVGGALVAATALLAGGWLAALAVSPLALLATPVVVLPGLVLGGYDVATLRAGLRRERATPSFVRWRDLLVDGVRATVVTFAYAFPGLLLLAAGLLIGVGAAGGAFDGVSTGTAAGGLAALLCLLLAAAYALVFAYVRPAALAVLAAEGRVAPAFSPRRLRAATGSDQYVVAWSLATTVWVVGVVLGTPLSVALVGVVVLFYARVVAVSLYARGASVGLNVDASGRTDLERPAETEPEAGSTPTVTPREPDRAAASRVRPEASASVQSGRTVPLPGAGSGREKGHGTMRPAGAGSDGSGEETDGPDSEADGETERTERSEWPGAWERGSTRPEGSSRSTRCADHIDADHAVTDPTDADHAATDPTDADRIDTDLTDADQP